MIHVYFAGEHNHAASAYQTNAGCVMRLRIRAGTWVTGVPMAVFEDTGIWYALRERQMPSGEKKSTVSWSITFTTSSTVSSSRMRAPVTPRPPRPCSVLPGVSSSKKVTGWVRSQDQADDRPHEDCNG